VYTIYLDVTINRLEIGVKEIKGANTIR